MPADKCQSGRFDPALTCLIVSGTSVAYQAISCCSVPVLVNAVIFSTTSGSQDRVQQCIEQTAALAENSSTPRPIMGQAPKRGLRITRGDVSPWASAVHEHKRSAEAAPAEKSSEKSFLHKVLLGPTTLAGTAALVRN